MLSFTNIKIHLLSDGSHVRRLGAEKIQIIYMDEERGDMLAISGEDDPSSLELVLCFQPSRFSTV